MTTRAEDIRTDPSVLVLGPVAIVAAGKPKALRGQQGRILSLVATAYPASVSSDTLIDELWPDGAPKTARTGLAVVIHRLRDRLTNAGLTLTSEAGAYRLDLEPRDLDHQVFLARVADAEACLATRPGKAVRELEIALAMWRGDALQQFASSGPLRLFADFLDSERLRAEELLLEALLAAGHAESAAGLASRFAEAEPYREGRWEALMLALYRCGRQAEALRAAHRAKTVLAEDLGLSPRPQLVQLETDIATQSPSLDLAPTASPVEHSVARAVVSSPHADRPGPRMAGNFIGRDAEEDDLSTLLKNERLVTLIGAPGVGKSRLAAQFAYGEAQLNAVWLDLVDIQPPNLVAALAHTLGVRVGDDGAAALAETLRVQPTLLVFDNAEHLASSLALLAERLLDDCPGLVVLVTSRLPLASPRERQLRVGPLDVDEGIKLLLDRAPLVDGGDIDRDLLGQLVERLDAMPLHLELIAPTLGFASPEEVIAELEESVASLRGGGRSHPRHASLAAALDWSLQLLAPQDREVFDRIGIMAGVFTAAEVAQLVDQPLSGVRTALQRLAAQSLVTPVASGTVRGFRQLNTIRTYARNRLRMAGTFEANAQRHAEICLAMVEGLGAELHGPKEARAVAELQRWSDQITAAFEWLIANGQAARLDNFVLAMWEFSFLRQDFIRYGWPERLIEQLECEGHEPSAELLAAAALAAWAMDRFASSENLADRSQTAALVQGLPTPVQAIKARLNVAGHEERNDDAARHLTALIKQSKATASDRHHADNLVVLAMAMAQFGAIEQADEAASKAMRIANQTENPTAMAWARVARGTVCAVKEPVVATKSFMEAQAMALTVNNQWVEGMALSGLVTALRRSGRLEQARKVLIEVMQFWTRTRSVSQLHRCCVEAVLLLGEMGCTERAARVLAYVDLEVSAHPLTLADDRARLDELAADLRRWDGAVELRPARGLGPAVLAELQRAHIQ